MSKSKYGNLYICWRNMKTRCLNPNYFLFHRYGGRGIKVCESWLSFKNFLADMGASYQPGLSIERIDNNKGYFKENCRWATAKEQANNTKRNNFITYMGNKRTLTQWSEIIGIKRSTISQRINAYGWSVERALSKGGNFVQS